MRHRARQQQTFASRFRVGLAIAPSLALGCPAVMAQGASPVASASAAAGTLQTVTVTAERRAENARDVPSSVSTVSGEKLDVLAPSAQDVRLLSGRVPSLNIESSFGKAFPRFNFRSYGNPDFRANASQPVSLVDDDVVLESPLLKDFPICDLARVEVLAGPQGSLFGCNTPGGVVKFDSASPEIGATDGFGSVSFGACKTTNVEAAESFAVGPQSAARVSVLGDHAPNWITGYETVHTYSRGDIDGGFGAVFALPSRPGLIPFPSETAGALRGHRQLAPELGVESRYAGQLNWQAGVDYFNEKFVSDSYGYNSLGSGAQTSLLTDAQKGISYAALGSIRPTCW